MNTFDRKFFIKMNFPDKQVGLYFKSAEYNLRIAESSKIPEIIFKFSYDSLIKLGITICIFNGYKVKSRIGHHVKILEVLSNSLKDKDIEFLGNAMRVKRNQDLYGTGVLVSKKEADEYLQFVQNIFVKAKKLIFKD